MKTIALVLLCISTPTFADDWTRGDTNREAVYLAFHGIDWAQTRHIARSQDACRVGQANQVPNCTYFPEANPILGKSPSQDRVDAYFILTGLAHVYVASVLPPEWRRTFQYVTIGFEGGAVLNNFNIGVEIRF